MSSVQKPTVDSQQSTVHSAMRAGLGVNTKYAGVMIFDDALGAVSVLIRTKVGVSSGWVQPAEQASVQPEAPGGRPGKTPTRPRATVLRGANTDTDEDAHEHVLQRVVQSTAKQCRESRESLTPTRTGLTGTQIGHRSGILPRPYPLQVRPASIDRGSSCGRPGVI